MESDLTWRGVEIDGWTALVLLEWQRELGVDEPMLDAPLDRTDLPPPPKPAPMMPAAPAAPMIAAEPDHAHFLTEAESLAARAQTLDQLAEAQQGFDGVELKRGARNFVFSDGNPAGRVMIIGEAPGEEEDAQGRPFVGRAGQLLTKIIEAMGLTRDEVFIGNIVKCRPPENRKPLPDEMSACLPYLRAQIEQLKPKLIVALGATAVQGLLQIETVGITKLRGQWMSYQGIDLMPTFHPAYLLRNPPAKREVWEDMKAVLAKLGKTPPKRG